MQTSGLNTRGSPSRFAVCSPVPTSSPKLPRSLPCSRDSKPGRQSCCLYTGGNKEEEELLPWLCFPGNGNRGRETRAVAGQELCLLKGKVTRTASGACGVMFRRSSQLWVLLHIGCLGKFLQHPEGKTPLGPLQFLLLMHWLLNT